MEHTNSIISSSLPNTISECWELVYKLRCERDELKVRNQVLLEKLDKYEKQSEHINIHMKRQHLRIEDLERRVDSFVAMNIPTKNDWIDYGYECEYQDDEPETEYVEEEPITYFQGAQGKYYVVNGHKYHIKFPVQWAKNHILEECPEGTFCGPERCMDCDQGKLRGVFVKYCRYCQELFKGERGRPDDVEWDNFHPSVIQSWLDREPYLKGSKLEEIGDEPPLVSRKLETFQDIQYQDDQDDQDDEGRLFDMIRNDFYPY